MKRPAVIVCVGVLVTMATPASASPVAATCIEAFDEGQRLQSGRQLRLAREALLTCAKQECPAVIRSDCTQVLREVEAAIPTVVFKATDQGGHDLSDVHVDVDGVRVADSSPGAALSVDPGKHVIRFEQAPWPPVVVPVVVGQGEKNRVVAAVLGPPRSPNPPPRLAPPSPRRSLVGYAVPIGVGAVGVFALTVAAVTRVALANDVSRLEATCGTACPPDQRESLYADLRTANISLGIGIGLLAIAGVTWFVFAPETQKVPSRAVGIRWDGLSW